jgi:hypothetical protein
MSIEFVWFVRKVVAEVAKTFGPHAENFRPSMLKTRRGNIEIRSLAYASGYLALTLETLALKANAESLDASRYSICSKVKF